MNIRSIGRPTDGELEAYADHQRLLDEQIEYGLASAIEAAVERHGPLYAYEYLGGLLEERRPHDDSSRPPKKKRINGNLRRAVHERDAYRCVACGGYANLTVDHIHPESKGGATTLENLQTMCASCNSRKGTRVA